jgi:hypothetical protein
VLEHRRVRAFAEALADQETSGRQDGPSQSSGRHSTSRRSTGAETGTALSPGAAQLLATVEALGNVPPPVMDQAVRATQRAQLVAAFERAFAAVGGAMVPEQRRQGAHRAAAAVSNAAARLRPRTSWGRRLAAGGLAAGVAIGGLAGVAMASTGALPGDAFYPVKRGMESWQLDWADSDSERGSLLLEHAATRMREAQQLLSRSGRGEDPASLSPATVRQISQALADMNAEGLSGRDLLRAVYRSNGSLAPMRKLASFTQTQDDRWLSLRHQLPEQLAPVAYQVTQLLDDMKADVEPLHILPQFGQGGSEGGAVGGDAPGGPGATTGPGRSASGSPAPSDGSSAAPGDRSAPAQGGSYTPGGTPAGGAGGLVNGLTGGLSGDSAPTSSSTGTPSSPPSTDSGISVPPLIPGLLPGLGLKLS